jgi:hypothetical protein
MTQHMPPLSKNRHMIIDPGWEIVEGKEPVSWVQVGKIHYATGTNVDELHRQGHYNAAQEQHLHFSGWMYIHIITAPDHQQVLATFAADQVAPASGS